MIAAPRVALRPFEQRHCETSLPWVNDPEICRLVDRAGPVIPQDEDAWYRRSINDETQVLFAVEMLDGDRQHIGNCGLKQIHLRARKAELWIYVGSKSAWGKRLGREALTLLVDHGFRELELHRIWLYCPEYNERAIRLYRSVGFRVEGKLREDVFQDGRYWNSIRMGILRREWLALAGMAR